MAGDSIETIVKILAPYVGEPWARAVINGSLEKMGTTAARATPAEIEKLVVNLSLGLNVFVGKEKTKKITDELSKQLKTAK